MALKPRINDTNPKDLYLEWDKDPHASSYSLIAPDGSLVEVGKRANTGASPVGRVRLGNPTHPFVTEVAPDYPQQYERVVYPPLPPLPDKLFGITPPWPLQKPLAQQLTTGKDIGLKDLPRIDGSDAAAQAVIAAGYDAWTAYIGGSTWPTTDQVVNYCRKYPQAWIDPQNEANLKKQLTVKQVAAKQIEIYNAVKAAGLPNTIMLSSVGNSLSGIEQLKPLDWCKWLVVYGCTEGKGWDMPTYHMYGDDPDEYDQWMNVWTLDSDDCSCQSVFGDPPYMITEFGCRIGKDTPDERGQAAAAIKWVNKIRSLPNCLGGHWFCLHDDNWAGFGVINVNGTHKLAYDALKTTLAAPAVHG
jgi:hypothetical protein